MLAAAVLCAAPVFGAGPARPSADLLAQNPDLPETISRPDKAPVAPPPATPPAAPAHRDSAADSPGRVVITAADSLAVLADSTRLFLTWNAPYGSRRASFERMHVCGRDTADTLFLSFRASRSSTGFIAYIGSLVFRSAPGDTLGTWWHFDHNGEHAGGLIVQFDPHPSFHAAQPWSVAGMGFLDYKWGGSAAVLRMVYAVPDVQAGPIEQDRIYVVGRVILRDDPGLPGCAQPVCIEWREAALSYSPRYEPVVRAGDRFASWNSPKGAVCDPLRPARRPAAWRPGRR